MSTINSSTSTPVQQQSGKQCNPQIKAEIQSVGGKAAVQSEMSKTGKNFMDSLQELLSGKTQAQPNATTSTAISGVGNNLSTTA